MVELCAQHFEYAIKVVLEEMTLEQTPVLYRDGVNALIENQDDLLKYVREKKWEEIKQERDRLETAGLPFKNSVLDYNLRSAFKLEVAKSAAESAIKLGLAQADDIATTWTMQDNSEMDLTYTDLLQIPLVAKEYSNSLHEKGRIYRTQIESMTDIKDILSISW